MQAVDLALCLAVDVSASVDFDEFALMIGGLANAFRQERIVQAAMDLGARPWRVFVEIILPLTRPGIAAGVMLVFIPAIGMFAITDLLGGAKVPMIGNVIQSQFGIANNRPFGAALGITVLAVFMLAFFLLTRGQKEAS